MCLLLCPCLCITSCPHSAVSQFPLIRFFFFLLLYAVMLCCFSPRCCSATWVMWWVVPVRNTGWAIYSLCSPELGCLTAGLLAAAVAAAASVFVSPLLSNTSRIQQGPTSLTYMNALNQQVRWQVQADWSESACETCVNIWFPSSPMFDFLFCKDWYVFNCFITMFYSLSIQRP